MSKKSKKAPQKAPNPPNPVGSPSLYKPEYCQALLDYFGRPPYEEKMVTVVTKQGDVFQVPKDVACDFPTLAGFAIKIGVHRDTLQEWSHVHPEFSVVYKRAKDFQEHFMAVNGNKGLVNTTFAIFTSKNIINWRDKRDDEKPIDTEASPQKLQCLIDQLQALAKYEKGN